MTLDPNQAASSRRVAFRAFLLVAPLVLGALVVPRVLASLKVARQPPALDGAVAPTAEPEPPPKPEAPTAEQLDKAVDATKALAAAERGWSRAEVIAPSAPAQPGVEQTAPFQGFGLSIESEPDGASVSVDGRTLGETPLLTGLPCTPGAVLQLRVARDPRPAKQLTTVCRADTLVKLRVRLGP